MLSCFQFSDFVPDLTGVDVNNNCIMLPYHQMALNLAYWAFNTKSAITLIGGALTLDI